MMQGKLCHYCVLLIQTLWNKHIKKHCFSILATGVLWVGEHVCDQVQVI